jgi:indolepyruvate ferredoxin oxidoreductase beta subunit
MAEREPIRLLIAALGGEGGGVLAGWISEAASAGGLIVSRTSIPGVAQRTGATTYYIEMVEPSGPAKPILALNPAPGQVDILLATELLEAARMVQAGYVTPARTLVIVADRRVYATDEKIALTDGRIPVDRLRAALERFSKKLVLADLAAVAEASESPLNAVLLGALAGAGVLPIAAEAYRDIIRVDGKAVDANLRGFEAGLKVVVSPSPRASPSSPQQRAPTPASAAGPHPSPLPVNEERGQGAIAAANFPGEAHAVVAEGIARLTDYQDAAYAERYLERVRRIARHPRADGALVRELARHLAVRMSVEDVIRVAQLKLRSARIARVVHEAQARDGDIVDITEYMKPGPKEIFGLLPPGLGRWALAHVRHDRSWPLKVRTTRLSGFLRLKLLAGLRFWRPRTLHFAEGEAWVECWLRIVERALDVEPEAAREVVATAALVRGYAETHKRGLANWNRIVDGVIEPGLSGALPRAQFADAVLQARLAAVKDPEGETLQSTLAAIGRLARSQKLAAE